MTEKPGVEGVWAYDPVVGWDPERSLPPVRMRSFADNVYYWALVFILGCAIGGIAGTIITSEQPQYNFGKRIGNEK